VGGIDLPWRGRRAGLDGGGEQPWRARDLPWRRRRASLQGLASRLAGDPEQARRGAASRL